MTVRTFTPLTTAVLKLGLIPKGALAEFIRWKAPIEIPDDIPAEPQNLAEVSERIEQALLEEGFVLMRETDLQVLTQYLSSQRNGTLHVEVFVDDPTIESKADIPVVFGTTALGEIILPWKGEVIQEEMTSQLTYLQVDSVLYRFTRVRELFFGDHKAFMVCAVDSDKTEVRALEETNGSSNPT